LEGKGEGLGGEEGGGGKDGASSRRGHRGGSTGTKDGVLGNNRKDMSFIEKAKEEERG
jgi:hypothetical protein